ncbi:prolyl oligopeptidase family serine peptidase [Streptomyces sp. NPDC059985]|uniref:prolyl oligopeptidase family serine peptidase n=1 Tax=Streptomyces sp. NPDC059985 TaxID=3347025 RepID=UPI0036805F0F
MRMYEMPLRRYPPAPRADTVDVFHGRTVPDPYRWLEEGEGEECRQWLAAQEELFSGEVSSWAMRPVFQSLLQELTGVSAGTAPITSIPVERGQRRFFLSRGAGQDHPVLMCADGDRPGRILADPMAADPSGTSTLGLWRPSWSGRYVAFQLAAEGGEEPELRVLEVDSGQEDAPLAPGRPTPVAWLHDDSGFYYVAGSAQSASREVRLHLLNTPVTDDARIFETSLRQVSVAISPDGTWLSVSCAPGAQAGNAVRLADLRHSSPHAPEMRLIHDGIGNGAQALVKFGPQALVYAITNSGAAGGKVCVVNFASSSSDRWPDVIRMEPGHVLSGCVALAEPSSGPIRYLVTSTIAGSTRLSLYDSDGSLLSVIPTPGSSPCTLTQLSAVPSNPDRAWFIHTDFLHAPTVHHFSLADRSTYPHTQTPPDSDAGPTVQQETCISDDGTEIPLYLVLPAGPQKGPRPTILTAYGGFGVSAAPNYSPSLLAWAKTGGIYAIAAIRGGGEKGAAWHAAGSGANKPNAFTDFSATARWLVTEGWTTPRQLAIRGSSHSGLTVAAAITKDPAQYAAAVCSDALTDMVRYPHFGLGTWWIKEFGNPDTPPDLDTLLSYSPYHHVTPGTRYPAVLLTSPKHDPRVGEAHIRKFTAALQHATSSPAPILLRTEEGVGHGPRAVSLLIGLQSDILAFCAAQTGLTT